VVDYVAERGALPPGVDIAHGVIQSIYKGVTTTPSAAIARRLAPHGVGNAACYDQELLLPKKAPDTVRDIAPLVALYESQLLPDQLDLVGITTVRFDHDIPCHWQWELARGWARASFTDARNLVVQLVHHVPGLAGRKHKPHLHLLWPARELHASTFSAFSPLAKPGGREIIAAEWASWLEAHA
jgi:hypothetical protein